MLFCNGELVVVVLRLRLNRSDLAADGSDPETGVALVGSTEETTAAVGTIRSSSDIFRRTYEKKHNKRWK